MPMEERSYKVARYYLEEHEWNVVQAVENFKEDLAWERNNKVQINTVPISQKQHGGPMYS